MKRIVRKIGLFILGIILILVIAFGVLYVVYDQDLPKGTPGTKADALATKMLTAINHQQFLDTRFLEWSYAGSAHVYKWDKHNGKVEVKWGDYLVHLNLNTVEKSTVLEKGTTVLGDDKVSLIAKALSYFNNDSFWLVAPFKVFDTGTERSIVLLEDGSEALLVNYTAGGTTPGDSYLWKLGINGFPESYQMWVKIIPIGGLEASWDDWKVMENGLFLPASHTLGPITLSMGSIKAYD